MLRTMREFVAVTLRTAESAIELMLPRWWTSVIAESKNTFGVCDESPFVEAATMVADLLSVR